MAAVFNSLQQSSTVFNSHQQSSTVINSLQQSSTVFNSLQQSNDLIRMIFPLLYFFPDNDLFLTPFYLPSSHGSRGQRQRRFQRH
jgi:hypothetical protein